MKKLIVKEMVKAIVKMALTLFVLIAAGGALFTLTRLAFQGKWPAILALSVWVIGLALVALYRWAEHKVKIEQEIEAGTYWPDYFPVQPRRHRERSERGGTNPPITTERPNVNPPPQHPKPNAPPPPQYPRGHR